jgi:hypothetical protein
MNNKETHMDEEQKTSIVDPRALDLADEVAGIFNAPGVNVAMTVQAIGYLYGTALGASDVEGYAQTVEALFTVGAAGGRADAGAELNDAGGLK